jgi:hypothetical protein
MPTSDSASNGSRYHIAIGVPGRPSITVGQYIESTSTPEISDTSPNSSSTVSRPTVRNRPGVTSTSAAVAGVVTGALDLTSTMLSSVCSPSSNIRGVSGVAQPSSWGGNTSMEWGQAGTASNE